MVVFALLASCSVLRLAIPAGGSGAARGRGQAGGGRLPASEASPPGEARKRPALAAIQNRVM
jgi:hypothetical protein